MGITGLLPFLKKASREACIKDYQGCTVAIDSYCWLHKGAFSCADKLALGEKTEQYVYYCMKYVNMLLSNGIKPIMVFDGARLPSKEGVERERKERRETYRKKAAQLLRDGRRAEARECLQRCVDITPSMALDLMNACRAKGVDCIVAPYEADAQLAYLSKTGIAQIVITEDSDLILFGCKKVMYKMDFMGNGILVEQENLAHAMDLKADIYTFEKFRYMCILSGCDYLPSLPGIGLGKANKLFKLTRQTDMTIVLKKLPTILKMSQLQVSSDYIEGFKRADNTFLYQLCYDPRSRKQVPLNPYPEHVDPRELEYAGPYMSKERAFEMALGNLDHYSGKQIAHFDPDTSSMPVKKTLDTSSHMLSIWDPYYRPMKYLPSAKDVKNLEGVQKKAPKEVIITRPALKQNPTAQVAKRQREDDSAVLNDLADLYAESNSVESQSPQPKRVRCDWDVTNSESRDAGALTTETTFSSPQTEKSATSPSCRQSLKEIQNHELDSYDSKKGLDNNSSPSATTDLPVKTSKNVFALQANVQKKTFNLNAHQSDVRSRFFAADPKPHPKTNFFHSLCETQTESQPEAESNQKLENGGEQVSEQTDSTNPADVLKTEITHTETKYISERIKNTSNPSKVVNKLQIFKSTFNIAGAPKISSPRATGQFKPVCTTIVDKINTENKDVSTKPIITIFDSTKGDIVAVGNENKDEMGNESAYFSSSQNVNQEPSLDPASPQSSQNLHLDQTNVVHSTSEKNATSATSCRRVGLSKGSSGTVKPGAAKSMSRPDKQSSIVSFLSRFANVKKS